MGGNGLKLTIHTRGEAGPWTRAQATGKWTNVRCKRHTFTGQGHVHPCGPPARRPPLLATEGSSTAAVRGTHNHCHHIALEVPGWDVSGLPIARATPAVLPRVTRSKEPQDVQAAVRSLERGAGSAAAGVCQSPRHGHSSAQVVGLQVE